MAFYTIAEAQAEGAAFRLRMNKQSSRILHEEAASFSALKAYDVFLSHSVKDADTVLGVREILKKQGLTVYVDWIEDPQLDRTRVTAATAEMLRTRMRSCKSLVYLSTDNSSSSKWMPWELGYFDGHKPKHVGVMLLSTDGKEYEGMEYLGLYPRIQKGQGKAIFLNPQTRVLMEVASFIR